MKRRSRGNRKEAKTRRNTMMRKRRNALTAASRNPAVADLQRRLDCQTHALIEVRELQAATAEVFRVISISPNDTQPVFDTIAENALRVCQGQFAFVLRFDNELLRVGACHGLTPEGLDVFRRSLPRPVGDDTAAGRAILRRAVVQIPDVLADPTYGVLDVAQTLTYRSALAVPMLRDGNPIGVVAVACAQVGSFSAGQVALMQTFAHQAVIAVENARVLNELHQRTTDLAESLKQQTATSEVLTIISSSPAKLEPVFQALLTNATRLCGALFGTLSLYEGGGFRIAAFYNVPPGYAEVRLRQLWRPHPSSGGADVVRIKQPLQINDVRTSPAYLSDWNARALVDKGGARTLLLVPMLEDDSLVGLIGIYHKEVRPFTDKQIALVQNFAAQAVIAIENTRLLNELRESLDQQTATSEVLSVISSSPGELEPVFQAMLQNATRLCDANFGSLFEFADGAFRALSNLNTPPALVDFNAKPRVWGPHTALGRLAHTRQTVHVEDALADRAYQEDAGRKAAVQLGGIRTLLAVPMLKDDVLVGAITIFRQEVRPFTEKQIALVTNFAAQAVIAIENARLLNELRERNEEVVNLNQQLEQRVENQVGEIERMSKLRRFLPPQVADLIVASGTEKQLESHRREITALFCDLRGFTGFSESSDPEDVMALLRDYHAAIGQIIIKYNGTLERFAGDGVMVIFNDPVPVENPALQAVLMALDMRTAIGALIDKWRYLGHDLGFGIGIAHGFATLGTIGFEGRFDYAAIGTVSNVASRLCDEAKPGQILISPRVQLAVDKAVTVEPVGEFALKGIRRPMITYNVVAASPSKPN